MTLLLVKKKYLNIYQVRAFHHALTATRRKHPSGMDHPENLIQRACTRSPAGGSYVNTREAFPTTGFIQDLVDYSRTHEIETKIRLVKDLISNNTPPRLAVEKIGRSVAVHESMPFAIYAFLRCSTSFESFLP